MKKGYCGRFRTAVALEQSAETDGALLELRPEATLLDRHLPEPDSAECAEAFVDAVRRALTVQADHGNLLYKRIRRPACG